MTGPFREMGFTDNFSYPMLLAGLLAASLTYDQVPSNAVTAAYAGFDAGSFKFSGDGGPSGSAAAAPGKKVNSTRVILMTGENIRTMPGGGERQRAMRRDARKATRFRDFGLSIALACGHTRRVGDETGASTCF